MKELTLEWLKSAKDDLLLIESIGTKEPLTHMIAFHSQQAIEKSLKAALFEFENQTPKVHSITSLFDRVSKYIKIEIVNSLNDELDKLYIDSRYPGDIGLLPYGKPSVKDANNFYQYAKNICSLLTAFLKSPESES